LGLERKTDRRPFPIPEISIVISNVPQKQSPTVMRSLTSITTGDEHVSCGRHCSLSIQMRNTNNELTIGKRRQNCGKEDANDIEDISGVDD
jgi:hypothetical protein